MMQTLMHHSALINLHALECCRLHKIPKIFYAPSTCVYPKYNQFDPESPTCEESTVTGGVGTDMFKFELVLGAARTDGII